MRLSETRTGELLGAVAAYCARLVNGRVRDEAARLFQRRLIGVGLVAPFLIAAPVSILLPPLIGSVPALMAVAAIFATFFLCTLLVTLTGRTAIAEALMLVFGTAALGAIVAAAGGIGSPAALVLAALPFECWWVTRRHKAALAGGAAALVALALQGLPEAQAIAVAPSAFHWLVPVAWLALVAPRLAVWLDERMDAGLGGQRPLEEIIEAVVIRMDLAGEVTDASGQARRILGLAPELILSGGLFDRVHVADRVAYLCALADLKQTAGFRRVDVRIRVPGSAGNSASDFRAFGLEMTRADAEDESITILLRAGGLTEAGAVLAQADEAAEMGAIARNRMLAAVSHELRTPLNSIIGFSDMLLHDMLGRFSDPRQREYVGLVRESGNHLLSVVNSILDVSCLESGTYASSPEPFRFADAVDCCRSMLQQQAGVKGLAVKADIPSEIGEVHADRRAVQQILINLLSNAFKFTPEGGTVAISAKRIGSGLHFAVSDTGIGIAGNDLTRLGEPFIQVRNDDTRQCEGAGLGLWLVKRLVSLHGGTMSIESEPGHGTTVTIGLPVAPPVAPPVVQLAEEEATDPAERHVRAANTSQEIYDGTYRKSA